MILRESIFRSAIAFFCGTQSPQYWAEQEKAATVGQKQKPTLQHRKQTGLSKEKTCFEVQES